MPAAVIAPFTVTRDNNRSSTGMVNATTIGPVGRLFGMIEKGLFAGSPFTGFVVVNPQGPLQCDTTGITDAVVSGPLIFQ